MATIPKLLLSIGCVLVVLGLAVVLYVADPAVSHIFPPCPFHALTGLYCPGCGSLRGLHQLLHGHLAAALGFNPLMVIMLPFVTHSLTSIFLRSATGRSLPSVSVSHRWIALLPVLVIAYWVLRNIPVAPFTYLAP